MVFSKPMTQKPSWKSLRSSASVLGLTAGAVGWSGLAQAVGEETATQMMLVPDHYELLENGVAVFKLETGEDLSLTPDQYIILEDGLLLVTDELAQASIYSLPVMGSVRAQLLSDLSSVATIDGTVAKATPAQTLSITEGQAPRLSEQVELHSYEVAQSSDNNSNTSTAGDALAASMAVAPGAMALVGMLMLQSEPGPKLKMWDLRVGKEDSYPEDFEAIGGKLYFGARTDSVGDEMWVYDGINDPYVLADINEGPGSSYPDDFIEFDRKIVFRADDGTHGRELWAYNHINDPYMVMDIRPGSEDSSPGRGIVFKGNYYFSADDGQGNGSELWSWDGQNDPSMVFDIATGSDGSNPIDFTIFDRKLYFEANNDEIWAYNGVDDPSLVTTATGDVEGFWGPSHHGFVKYNDKLYMRISDPTLGVELYSFDGENAPELVYDFNGSEDADPNDLNVFNGNLYFTVDDGGNYERDVYVYDGVNDPTKAFDINPRGGDGVEDLFAHEGSLWFGANFNGRDELWTWDGENEPQQVTDINPDGIADPWQFTSLDGKLYFQAETDEFGEELWVYG